MKRVHVILIAIMAVFLAITSCTEFDETKYGGSSWRGESENTICTLIFTEDAQQCHLTFGAKAPALGFGKGTYDVEWLANKQFSLHYLLSSNSFMPDFMGEISGNHMELWMPGIEGEVKKTTEYHMKRITPGE